MFLKTKVKADNINNLTDARYFAAAGVEWLGFSVSNDSQIEDIQSIIDWVDGVKIVLEINGHLTTNDYKAIEALHPNFIQTDIHCDLEELHEAIPVIRVIPPSVIIDPDLLELLEENVENTAGFIIDLSAYSWSDLQSDVPVSISTLKKIIEGYSCLLKLNYSSKDINWVIETLKPDGICLEGGNEEKVGYKSFEPLDDLLETLGLD